MTLAPIILFVYNRPDHTSRTLNSLMNNELSSESELIIFADGIRAGASDKTKKQVEETRRIIREKKWCGKVTIVEHDINNGLAESVIEGVTSVVNKYGRVIVLEDDMLLSPFFLKFMNEALDIYESNDSVACISGYIYPVKGQLPETFFIKGADCWGWATWARAWNEFEPDGQKLLREIEGRKLNSEFDFDNSFKYTDMLRKQVAGENSSWAIRWYASAFLKNRYCLYPGVSLVQNIGIDGSGTHSGNSTKWEVELASRYILVKPMPIKENELAKKQIIAYFRRTNKEDSIAKRIARRLYHKFFVKPPKHGWFGNYKTWAEAQKHSKGYDAPDILEKVKSAVLKVKNGEAPYERDSVVFEKIEYSEPLLIAYKEIMRKNDGMLEVVDFGGSLGSSYFQARALLANNEKLKWAVVEQKHFVDCGKQNIEDSQLKFYYTIDEALKLVKPQVLLLSSVIQYLEKPYDFLEKCMSYGFEYIIVDRTGFIESSQDRLTVQVVPEYIYKASYPAWFLNEDKFKSTVLKQYSIEVAFISELSKPILIEKNTKVFWKGFILKRK